MGATQSGQGERDARLMQEERKHVLTRQEQAFQLDGLFGDLDTMCTVCERERASERLGAEDGTCLRAACQAAGMCRGCRNSTILVPFAHAVLACVPTARAP